MEHIYLTGYISVFAALSSESRRVNAVLLDRDRYNKVMKGKFHQTEKRQYSVLKRLCTDKGVPVRFTSFGDNTELYGSESGGIVAEVGERIFTSIDALLSKDKPFLAAIDGIEDPYNFGQVLRSFYASGVDGVIVPKRNFFTASAIVARASAGASELLAVSTVESMEEFCDNAREKGIKLYATAAEKDALDLFETSFSRPVCIIFGGERRGISKKVMEKCDGTVRITYPRNVSMSLSASSAAAVIAFEIGRRLN